jgi:adhesin/invasin
VAIVQNIVPNNIALAANPGTIKGDGISTSVLTATVTKGVGGAAVVGDTVTFTAPGANCGTLSAATASTDASGHATVTYTSKVAPSTFCVVNATEANTSSTTSVTITQTA